MKKCRTCLEYTSNKSDFCSLKCAEEHDFQNCIECGIRFSLDPGNNKGRLPTRSKNPLCEQCKKERGRLDPYEKIRRANERWLKGENILTYTKNSKRTPISILIAKQERDRLYGRGKGPRLDDKKILDRESYGKLAGRTSTCKDTWIENKKSSKLVSSEDTS